MENSKYTTTHTCACHQTDVKCITCNSVEKHATQLINPTANISSTRIIGNRGRFSLLIK